MSLFIELRNDITGTAVLRDWLGEGGSPVGQVQANRRAMACCAGNGGSPCPNNVAPNWWEEHVKDPIAEVIRKQLEIKNKIKLTTKHDDKLAMCSACGCNLSLKVQVPIEHIKRHTPRAVIDKLTAYCWLREELLTA